jgi:hypothetical protein
VPEPDSVQAGFVFTVHLVQEFMMEKLSLFLLGGNSGLFVPGGLIITTTDEVSGLREGL